MLSERGVGFENALPANLARGSVAFIAADDDVKHNHFMTEAWAKDPLKVILRRITGFSRIGIPTDSTAKKKVGQQVLP